MRNLISSLALSSVLSVCADAHPYAMGGNDTAGGGKIILGTIELSGLSDGERRFVQYRRPDGEIRELVFHSPAPRDFNPRPEFTSNITYSCSGNATFEVGGIFYVNGGTVEVDRIGEQSKTLYIFARHRNSAWGTPELAHEFRVAPSKYAADEIEVSQYAKRVQGTPVTNNPMISVGSGEFFFLVTDDLVEKTLSCRISIMSRRKPSF